jgi:hypothetical protein
MPKGVRLDWSDGTGASIAFAGGTGLYVHVRVEKGSTFYDWSVGRQRGTARSRTVAKRHAEKSAVKYLYEAARVLGFRLVSNETSPYDSR